MRIKATPKGDVPYTPEEEATADLALAKYEAAAPEREAKEAKQLAKEDRKSVLKSKTKDKTWSALTKAEKDAILEHYAIANGLI